MLASSNPSALVETLREQLRRLEIARRTDAAPFSSGSAVLDRALPAGGLHRGTLVEYLAEPGSGAAALALIAGREACRDRGAMVVVDMPSRAAGAFYPPAAANLGIEPERLVLVRPRTQKDFRWALNQSLGCQGVGAVVCWPDRLDSKTFRQWQLAAESAGTIGFLIRPNSVRGQPSWADLQLLVETLPVAANSATSAPAISVRRLRVEIVRCRNGNSGSVVELELDDETGTLQESRAVRVASAMAGATPANRSSGA